MVQRVLLADIGNTSLKIGLAPVVGGQKLVFGPNSGSGAEPASGLACSYSLPTRGAYSADSMGLTLLSLLRHEGLEPKDIAACIVCSVVPGLDPIFTEACRRFLKQEPLRFPHEFCLNMENHYERPAEVGADRLLAAFAARRLYPEPVSLISVDYGTATTFDCVSGNAYLGGLICPGVLSSHGALATDTAKLPRISLEVREDEPLVGHNTSTSLSHGFMFGFAAMSEGLVARLRQQLPGPVEVVATGGFAPDIARVWNGPDHLRPDLILEGLRLAWMEHRNL